VSERRTAVRTVASGDAARMVASGEEGEGEDGPPAMQIR
jgi:hypothetical protein